ASLLDEATAVAEAMTMLRRVSKSKAPAFFVDVECHPQVIQVVRTRAVPLHIDVIVGDPSDVDPESVYGVVLAYPGTSGVVRDYRELIGSLKQAGVMVAVATDLLALTLLTPPGEMGADVAVGSSQRFGVPLMYGGPHAAFMATRDQHKRSLPGRLVGVSKDSKNRMALRLALTTREQHIRREKATSNICTAQALLAVMAGLYAAWHGPDGLRQIAEEVHRLTSGLAALLSASDCEVVNDTWFDTLTVRVPGRAEEVVAAAEDRRINLRFVDVDHVGVSIDETTTDEIVKAVAESFFTNGQVGEARSGIP
ncbi:MAG: glycine dehydrogenase (aminomethyl-transferring), partial [bacterium]|nr:glycine dehydrogenase (aminomethyl-transferring) [bacterium]